MTCEVMATGDPRPANLCRMDAQQPARVGALLRRVATAPQTQPARPRPPGGHLRAASVLRGDRPRAPEPDDGAAPVRCPGRPPARAQHLAAGRRLRTGIPGEQPRRRDHDVDPVRARHHADGARAVPRRRRRPMLERAGRQPGHVRPHGRHTTAPARATAQCVPPGPAPRRTGLTAGQPPRGPSPLPRTSAPPGQRHRGRGTARAVRGGAPVPRPSRTRTRRRPTARDTGRARYRCH